MIQLTYRNFSSVNHGRMTTGEVPHGPESQVRYEPPTLEEVGDVVELTRGTADADTADMKTSKYW